MVFFYILLLFPMMMQSVTIKGLHLDYEKRNKRAITFFFCLLTILIMFRHENVGRDTSSYINYFRYYSGRDWQQLWREQGENGYIYFNKMISVFSKDPQIFLAAAALLVSIMIYPLYKRLCVDASLTIMLFATLSTFFMMFSGIRQMLAIGIGFVAYDFTRRKKVLFFLLSVFLATTFHTSAFMLYIMYPLYHARITKRWLYVVVPTLLICFAYNRQIFGYLSLILERYTEYDTKIEETGAYTMLVLFGVFSVFSFLIPDEKKLDPETIGLRNFLLLGFVLQMFVPLHSLAMRMGYYYIVFIPLLLPKIIAARSRKWNQIAILARHVMVVFFLLYFFLNAAGEGNLRVFPYHFYWENVR